MGYFGFSNRDEGEQLLIDCGPLGPDYQPGHGHCDLLSFEWYLDGQPIVVDSGVSGYEGDPLREYVRSTRAHNTVTFDGREQSELWGTFRVARRASDVAGSHSLAGGTYTFEGQYRPFYDRRVRHHRTLVRTRGGLEIRDRMEAPGVGTAHSFLHLHPALSVYEADGVHVVTAGATRLEIQPWGVDRVEIVRGSEAPTQGWYCPEFGVRLPAPVLVLSARIDGTREFGYTIRIVGGNTEAAKPAAPVV